MCVCVCERQLFLAKGIEREGERHTLSNGTLIFPISSGLLLSEYTATSSVECMSFTSLHNTRQRLEIIERVGG